LQRQNVVTGIALKVRDAIGSLPMLRVLPIRWRILSLAAFNVIMAAIFAAVIWNGAQTLRAARNELRLTRDSDRLLALLETQSGNLQSLIHRYFTQPNADLLNEIMELRTALLNTLKDRAAIDPMLGGSAPCRRPSRPHTNIRYLFRRAKCPASMPLWKEPRGIGPR
jgi:hypothetical protein